MKKLRRSGYYDTHLAAQKLLRCYQVASPRVKQYFKAEIEFVLKYIKPRDVVLDMGCGYGRVIPQLARKARFVYGIDTSASSLTMGKEFLAGIPNCELRQMDASSMDFAPGTIDLTICLQNGLSAFHTDQRNLVRESIRVTKPGGTILFSSYSEKFWEHRLGWFQRQAMEGLIGEIDPSKTRNGFIVCRDGFTATTVRPEEFRKLIRWMRGISFNWKEVDGSSVFFILKKKL